MGCCGGRKRKKPGQKEKERLANARRAREQNKPKNQRKKNARNT